MFLGILILKKKYVLREYISIFLITLGIIMCTWASAKDVKKSDESAKSSESEIVDFLWWIVGKK